MERQIELNDEQSGDDILLCTYESTRYRRAFPHFLREETSVRIVIIIPEGSPASCGYQRNVMKTRKLSCTRF
jgi:hypothetical protein